MKKLLFGIILLIFAGTLFALEPDLQFGNADSSGVLIKPVLAGAASLLVPGGGQIYTGHYLKAGTFIALEAITASFGYYWYKSSRNRSELALDFLKEVKGETGIDSARGVERYRMKKQEALEARHKFYNAMSWTVGVHAFNVLDALGGSGLIKSGGYRDPAVAGWLAAIPGLGLGQIYNGSLSKAGMVLMTQVSLGAVAFNYHRSMKEAEKQMAFNKDKLSYNELEIKNTIYDEFSGDWESKRRGAFRNRNTYLWYSLFFYFYSIFDAVVDAHLHDYNDKMILWPDLVPKDDGAQLLLNVKF